MFQLDQHAFFVRKVFAGFIFREGFGSAAGGAGVEGGLDGGYGVAFCGAGAGDGVDCDDVAGGADSAFIVREVVGVAGEGLDGGKEWVYVRFFFSML